MGGWLGQRSVADGKGSREACGRSQRKLKKKRAEGRRGGKLGSIAERAFLQAGHPEQKQGSKLKRIGRSVQPDSLGPGMVFSLFCFPCFSTVLLCF